MNAHSPILNGIPALWVARRRGIPIVYEMRALWEDAAVDHGTHHEHSARYQVSRGLESWLLRRVDAVGVISEGLAQDLAKRGVPGEKIFRTPNGVDTERFQPIPRDPEVVRRLGLQEYARIGVYRIASSTRRAGSLPGGLCHAPRSVFRTSAHYWLGQENLWHRCANWPTDWVLQRV